MAQFKNSSAVIRTEAPKIDERVECIINRDLSADQKKAGVVAKVQMRHPAASFIVTVWSKDGRKFVSEPSQEGNKKWFPLVQLNKEVKEYILHLVENSSEDKSAWYLDMLGDHTTKITADASNPDLGIEAITIDTNLTYNQTKNGIICKVNLVTTIGSFLGYTIWNSKFGESLYGSAPTEGAAKTEGDDRRGAPGYRLSREATAQVLNFLHPQVDFTKAPEVPEDVIADNAPTAEAEDKVEGFEPVGDAMFEADK